MSEPSPAVSRAADAPPDGGRVVWYRSFYWRIAIGFVATVAVVLALQAALFLWLASTNETIGMRPARVATVAAAELSSALEADAGLDVDAWLAREFGRGPHGVFVVRGDRIHRSGPFEVPPFLDRMARFRLRVPDQFADQPPPGPPPDGRPPGDGRGPRPRRPPFQPVVVRGQTVAIVGVLPPPPGRDPVAGRVRPDADRGRPGAAHRRHRGDGHRSCSGPCTAACAASSRPRRRSAPARPRSALPRTAATKWRRWPAASTAWPPISTPACRSCATPTARAASCLADVSHELMTPLTAMRGYLETLALPAAVKDDATRARYLGIVTEETLRLEAIIGDLLDLARLDGGGGSFEREAVPLARLFERAFARHQGTLDERGVVLDRHLAAGAEAVLGDERRLEQVLQNLVANAVRHTPRGGRIALRAAPAGDEVVLIVEDSGPGIPAEHLPHVFDRFYRVDPARDARSGGSGLGLSIVRAVVEQHGGRVSATNGAMGGARFELRLPAARGSEHRAREVSASGTPA